MRHRKTITKLNRTASHRNALMSNLATQLFEHKKIHTTKAKAKAARPVVERLITFAKKGDLASRRRVLKTVRDKVVVKQLFDEIAPTFEKRSGGYTRIIKLGQRQGDGAEMAFLELVGFEGVRKDKKGKESKKLKKQKKAREKETEEVETED